MSENTPHVMHGDEIDLADLIVVLFKYKHVFLICFVILLLAGIAAAVVHKPKYDYSVSVQIGQISQFGQSNVTPVEDPKTAIAKINGGFIPEMLAKYRAAHPDDQRDYKFNVTNPDGSNLVVLDVKGTPAQGQLLSGFLNDIAQRLITEENRQTEGALQNLNSQLIMAKDKIKSLNDQIALQKTGIAGTNVAMKLAATEIKQLNKHIEATAANRDAVTRGESKSDKSFTLLLLNNELTDDRKRLFDLMNQHDVTLPQQRATLETQIKNLETQIQDQDGTVKQIQAQIDGVMNTHTVAPPLKSLNPVGFSRMLILALAVLAGIFVGFVGVFVFAMMDAVRDRITQSNGRDG
ncbi:MAG: Wzz/FepE/Etk N-terminal domain-containing protein [Gammaproteobacteria bacterium]